MTNKASLEIGRYITQPQGYKAFVPNPFPPERRIDFDFGTISLLSRADLSLGKLDGIAELLPDPDFFIFMYLRKEAALSSQLEGTRATLTDLIKAESDIFTGVPSDVNDIIRYISAINFGLARLSDIPLSLRLIRETHAELMAGGRSEGHAYPGEFRKTQNWIGGGSPATARFVPPPPHEAERALGEIERFIHVEDEMPPLAKAGLIHAQFETIHPFVDGNGRTGRLLTTFYLCQRGILSKPILYLSEYFKRNRDSYFDLLQGYHDRGEIGAWLNFFLEGVAIVSDEAIRTTRQLTAIRDRDREKISSMGRAGINGLILLKHLYRQPIVSIKNVMEATGLTRPNANRLAERFVDAGILSQLDKTVEYGRTFVYADYLGAFTKSDNDR